MAEAAVTLASTLSGANLVATRGSLEIPVRAVHHDSRRIEPGDVFFAVDGAQARGLDFAPSAVERGALAVVGEELADVGATAVAVESIRPALAQAACVAAGHPTAKVPTVGITGTNGKTTTTFVLEGALGAAGMTAGVIGTINARVGDQELSRGLTTPEADDLQRLAREMVDRGAGALLLEVSSHGIELFRAHGTCFRVVALTNLTQDHLDFHGTMEAYGRAKLRLFQDELGASDHPVAVVNIDDPFGREVAEKARCPVITVSAQGRPEADLRVLSSRCTLRGLVATLGVGEARSIEVRSPLVGQHNVANVTLAIGIAHALGVDFESACRGIFDVHTVPGRLEPVEDPRGNHVFVDYAHTPDALENVVGTLRQLTDRGRLVVLFGCGGDRDQTKRPLMGEAASRGADLVILTSDNPRTEDPKDIIDMARPGVAASGLPEVALSELGSATRGYAVEPDRRKAIQAALGAATGQDVVLIAGKGHEPYQILGTEKIHFDDREEAARAIELASREGAAER